MKKIVWLADANTICQAYDNAKANGTTLNEELLKLTKEGKVQCLGTTDKDGDLLAGDLREAGLKVLNVNEEQRKNERPKENT